MKYLIFSIIIGKENFLHDQKWGIYMGLFGSLFKAVGNAVSDAVSDAVSGTVSDAVSNVISDAIPNSAASAQHSDYDYRSFDQKLQAILPNLGNYEVRRNVSPDELEQEAGREIYIRGGCYSKPENLSYVLYKDGQCALIINLWYTYEIYKHMANRQIKDYCGSIGIKVLDFFDYLPNEANYMEDRIRTQLQ